MKRLAGWACALGLGSTLLYAQQTPMQNLTLDAGTVVHLAVTVPLWMKSAKAGDPVYMQTIFPVVTHGSVAIPAGSYVQAKLLDVKRPSRFNGHAQVDLLFTAIIYGNGYAVTLPDASPADAAGTPATAMQLQLQVAAANDLLLDNGTQLQMTLAAPLTLDAAQTADAVAKTKPIVPGALHSATRCVPIPATPGSPGTSDTVIPGSPGTPSTTIPGGPGMPDIVIPGTPATPDTIIPGTPGTPGFAGRDCPAPPLVTSTLSLHLPLAAPQTAQAKP